MNLTDSRLDSLDQGSVQRKAAICTGQYKQKNIHTSMARLGFEPSVRADEDISCLFFYLDYETIGTATTPGLLCQPRVIMRMIVESMMECKLAGETEVLGENLPLRHFCPSHNPTCPPGFEPGPPRWEAGE
jgi:hypothetical protein